MIKTATVFRHILDNGPATIAKVLSERDVAITLMDTFEGGLDHFDPLGPDLLVVMGGSCGVYQADDYPFLKDEMRIIKARLQADRPTLGICLGAQLMAASLGARVYKGAQGPELGWFPLVLTEAGRQMEIRHFDPAITPVMQWHGDTFDLPDGAVLLAGTPKFPHQVFQVGQNALALQCHVEVTGPIVRGWSVGAASAVESGDLDLPGLLKDTKQWADIMQKQTERFLRDWLDRVGQV